MSQKFTNNAKSRLVLADGQTFGDGDMAFTVTTDEGDLFPETTSLDNDHFLVTLESADGTREVVKITARSGDDFTVGERAVEAVSDAAPSAQTFYNDDLVELRLTAGFIDALKKGSIVFVIDGGGSAITTDIPMKGFIEIPFGGSIEACRLFADATTGGIVLDIYKTDFAGYNPDILSGDSIVASAPPTLSSAYASEDVTLTGWTRDLEAGDILYFEVTSASVITKCTVSLTVDRN